MGIQRHYRVRWGFAGLAASRTQKLLVPGGWNRYSEGGSLFVVVEEGTGRPEGAKRFGEVWVLSLKESVLLNHAAGIVDGHEARMAAVVVVVAVGQQHKTGPALCGEAVGVADNPGEKKVAEGIVAL